MNGLKQTMYGPAVFDPHSGQYWYINGKRHRLDGPAYISTSGTQSWWINGKDITNEVNSWKKESNIPENYTQWAEKEYVIFRLRF